MKNYNFILGCLILAIGFFGGITIERSSNVVDIDVLVYERDSIEGLVDHLQYNVDWNAMYNLELNAIAGDCKRCSSTFAPIKETLEAEKQNRGRLVVPGRNPVTKRQEEFEANGRYIVE